jgi:hypothetical protein
MEISHQSEGQTKVVSGIRWAKVTGIISTVVSRQLMAFTAITVLAILSTLFGVSPANAQEAFRVSIPASACAPANPNSQSLVRIVNGAYVFIAGSTGQAVFYCPLPLDTDMIPRIPQNNDHQSVVYYRDSDGTGNLAFVLAQLQRRDVNGVQNISDEFTSNSRAATGNTFGCITFNHNFISSNLYFFRVILRRGNTNQDPAFSGITFSDTCSAG